MNRDFEEFFRSLNSQKVEFLVIGGVAYNFYAPPRSTKDIDIWVRPVRDNLLRLLGAISSFGFPTEGLELGDLEQEQRVLMLGRVPNRIDILTRPTGVDWDTAWPRRKAASYGTTPIQVLGREDLVLAKRAAGRPRDLADVATLEAIARRERG